MKSFRAKIYFNRDKDSNWDLEEKAKELGFKDPSSLLYVGYEVEYDIEIFEDGDIKVLRIDGIDVSEKGLRV